MTGSSLDDLAEEDAVGAALNTSRSRRFISLQYVHIGYNSRRMTIQKPFTTSSPSIADPRHLR